MHNDITATVEAIGNLNFEGNIIPHPWYKAITFPNGKPDISAIIILAEIVYWYRPTIERDEATGAIVSVRKKFKADMLQRSYQSFAEQFGLTKRQCQDAIARLCALDFIRKELRTVDTSQGRMSNVLFVEPIAATLQRYSYHVSTYDPSHPNAIAVAPHGMTYTKTTASEIRAKKERRPPQGRSSRKGGYTDEPPPPKKKSYRLEDHPGI